MTLNFGLAGYPLDHSYSPLIHRWALREAGCVGDYKLYPCRPDTQDLPQLIDDMRKKLFQGLNITIPYKQLVMPFLDEIAEKARIIGAVNTIVHRSGNLIGENTDASGFWMDLKRFIGESEISNLENGALVLGAGGSARAVCYALMMQDVDLFVAARRSEQAALIIDSMLAIKPAQNIRKFSLTDLPDWISRNNKPFLIINTTPLGMVPWKNQSPWPEDLIFPAGSVLYDLVYNPAETQLMRQAIQQGCSVSNGLGMLVEQALLSFEMWSGIKVTNRTIFKELIRMGND